MQVRSPIGRTTWRVLEVLGALALVVAGCGSSDRATSPSIEAPTSISTSAASEGYGSTTTSPAATTPAGELTEVFVVGGEVEGGPARVEVAVGEIVTLRVTSDAAEVVHVHGYDLTTDLAPGVASEVSFKADIPGVFEVELERSGLHIADVRVG